MNSHTLSSAATSWTRAQIARVSRNSLVAHGISLTCVVLLLWLSSDYLRFFFSGPSRPTDPELLSLIESRADRTLIAYVELNDRQLLETGWQEVTTSDGRPYSQIPFFLAPVGDRYLLVLARSAADGRRLVGPIGPIRELEQEVVDATVRTNPALAGKVLAASMTSVAVFEMWGYILLTLLAPWSAYSLYRLAQAFTARFHPELHPLARQLAAAQGAGAGIDGATAGGPSLDEEMAGDLVLHLGKATLTESWFVRPTVFGVRSVRLDQIVWAYPLRQQAESFVVFALRSGRLVPVGLKDAVIQQVLNFLSQRYPWMLLGYDLEIAKEWKRSRQDLIAKVDARRAAQGESCSES